jgi:hypothetical protein
LFQFAAFWHDHAGQECAKQGMNRQGLGGPDGGQQENHHGREASLAGQFTGGKQATQRRTYQEEHGGDIDSEGCEPQR